MVSAHWSRSLGLHSDRAGAATITWKLSLFRTGVAAVAFQLAWTFPALNALVLVYAWALMRISEAPTAPGSFRFGFLTGMLVFAPQLAWFWNIFGPAAICLWAVLSFFTGAFVLSLHLWRRRFQGRFLWFAAPIL